MLLLVLEERAACCVDNGLGEASRTTGIQDIQRVGRWQLFELDRFIRGTADGLTLVSTLQGLAG